MTDISEVFHLQAKCEGNQIASAFCLTNSCKESSAICSKGNCVCQKIHSECLLQCSSNKLQYCISKKISEYKPIILRLSLWVDQTIKELVDLKQVLQINTKTFNFGLDKQQKQFVNKIKQQKYEDLTSDFLQTVIVSLESKYQFSENSEISLAVDQNLKQHSRSIRKILEEIKQYQQPMWFGIQKQQLYPTIVNPFKSKTNNNNNGNIKNVEKMEKGENEQNFDNSKKKQKEQIKTTDTNRNIQQDSKTQNIEKVIRLQEVDNKIPIPRPVSQTNKVNSIPPPQPPKTKPSQSVFKVIEQSVKEQMVFKKSLIQNSIIFGINQEFKNKKWNYVVFQPQLSSNEQVSHSFTITINKSFNNKNLMLFGFCHYNIIRAYNFLWQGPNDKSSYLILATNGSTYSALGPNNNLKKQMALAPGVYHLEYENISRTATFSHQSQNDKRYQTTLKVSSNNDPIYFCVALLEPGDQIEINYVKRQQFRASANE